MPLASVTFEDLPVLTQLGFESDGLSGRAVVDFDQDGTWGVKEIFLNATRPATKADLPKLNVRGEIEVEFDAKSPSWLYLAIWGQLTENPRYIRQIDKVIEAELAETWRPVGARARQIEAVA